MSSAPDGDGGVAAQVDLVALATDPKKLAGYVVHGVDSTIVGVASMRYGPELGARMAAPPDGRELLTGATAAYLESIAVQMSPGQALLLCVAMVYGPRAMDAERLHQSARAAARPTPPNGASAKGAGAAA